MFLLIDNYDSFTFNLVQAFQIMGLEPRVVRNDAANLMTLAASASLQAVVISPGPGGPTDSGPCLDFLATLSATIPVLGVCLGHQILAHYAGVPVVRAARIMHGKTSQIQHQNEALFAGLSNPFEATRYHSLIMTEAVRRQSDLPLTITARSEWNEPMGLQYRDRPWFGIQFHPESILSVEGPRLLENFARLALPGRNAIAPGGG